jgi:hypothetical protein
MSALTSLNSHIFKLFAFEYRISTPILRHIFIFKPTTKTMVKFFREQKQLPKITEIYLEEEDVCSYGSGTEASIPTSRAPPSEIRMKQKKQKLSPSKLIDLYLDEEDVPNAQDDHSLGVASDASSLPPPPPPLDERKRSYLRPSQPPAVELSLPRQAYVFEEKDQSFEAQDISVWPAHWNKWFLSSGRGRLARRRLFAATACLFVLCMILGLAIGIGNNVYKTEDAAQSTSFAGAHANQDSTQGGGASVTPGPTPIPSPEPTPGPTPGPVPEEDPPASCTDDIGTNKSCYGLDDIIWVGFANCNAVHDDWIGIYKVDDIFSSDSLGPRHSMWLWTCESQTLFECRNQGVFGGTIPFGGGLPVGRYQAFLVRANSNDEYVPYASSAEFEFSNSC